MDRHVGKDGVSMSPSVNDPSATLLTALHLLWPRFYAAHNRVVNSMSTSTMVNRNISDAQEKNGCGAKEFSTWNPGFRLAFHSNFLCCHSWLPVHAIHLYCCQIRRKIQNVFLSPAKGLVVCMFWCEFAAGLAFHLLYISLVLVVRQI